MKFVMDEEIGAGEFVAKRETTNNTSEVASPNRRNALLITTD
jgi:hypothetical protein